MISKYLIKGHEDYLILVRPYVSGYIHLTFRIADRRITDDSTPNMIRKFIFDLLEVEGKQELFDLIYLASGDDVLRFGEK
jgi:hypothetical protein